MATRRSLKATLALALIAPAAGCALDLPRSPVPKELTAAAIIPGLAHVRYWGDEAPKDAVTEIRHNMPALSRLAESPPENGKPVVNYLAISSGGDDGRSRPVCTQTGTPAGCVR